MHTFFKDVRFGLRILASRPMFTIVAILTLALGIASTTTVYSWIDSSLLHPYAGAGHPADLAVLEMVTPGAPNGGTQVSWVDYRDYRDQVKQLEGLAAVRQVAFTAGDPANSQLVWGELASVNYFDVLEIKPLIGRLFAADDRADLPGGYPVAVISDRLWRNRFRSDPKIIGKTLRVNRHELQIIGVAPGEFRGSRSVMTYDLWVPVTMGPQLGLLDDSDLKDRRQRCLSTIARLKPGVSLEQARSEVAAVGATLAAMFPKTNGRTVATLLPTWKEHNGIVDYLYQPLRVLMAASIVVLFIVCANVANLLLARSVARQKEFGIRLALGAGRLRLARQLLTETLLLAVAGAVIAVPLQLWMSESLPALVPSIGLPLRTTYTMNSRLFAFTALACILTALLCGAAPAFFCGRSSLNETLKEGGRSGSPGAGSHRMRSLLVITEVALAAVALVGAGLFVASFRNARSIDPGFDSSKVLFGRFFIESTAYTADQIQNFALRLRQRLESSPGVEMVSYSDFVPLSSTAGPYSSVLADGYVPAKGESLNVNQSMVAPGYFDTVRLPLLEGRDFTERDGPGAARVMIVNQTFARKYFNGANPVGRQVQMGNNTITVIGLARDSKYFTPAEPALPFIYLPFRRFYSGTSELHFFIRTKGQPTQAISTLRRAVADTDPNAAGFHAVPLAEYTQVALFSQKLAASLMGALGMMCLLLAGLGLYSVMSYAVSQRSQEIGIRMAMGARAGDVIAMIVRDGMRLAGIGIAGGVALALLGVRVAGVSTMLIRVNAADPKTFAGAMLFLALITLIATWLPARRATRIDPMTALRS